MICAETAGKKEHAGSKVGVCSCLVSKQYVEMTGHVRIEEGAPLVSELEAGESLWAGSVICCLSLLLTGSQRGSRSASSIKLL